MRAETPIPVLLVDGHDGKIVHANDAATKQLSSTRGFHCWNLVRARGGDGHEVCVEGCVQRLREDEGCEDREAVVRGKAVRLSCSARADLVVVSITPAARAKRA
jgi:hypothetical protein